jgi:glutamine amidotransferase
MPDTAGLSVAIVDYGMGNLFSVKQACEHVGLNAAVTSSADEVRAADAVILPGVGAYGDAMETLQRFGLADALREAAAVKPLVGICLGMQLLMEESFEFGRHEGLGIIPGQVVRLEELRGPGGVLKVPHVCWERLERVARVGRDAWAGTLLEGLKDGEYMYFVHSYYVVPRDENVVLATTTYGHIRFCSALTRGHVFACQGHPERSGAPGLKVYANLAALLKRRIQSGKERMNG